MIEIIKDKFIVLKNEDIEKYCKTGDLNALDFIRHKIAKGRENDGKIANNNYYICNTDEPYADQVLDVILNGENQKEKSNENCNELKITRIEADPEGVALLEIKYKGEKFKVFYYVDNQDEWHFFYKDGKKPADIDFEYKLMCNL